MLAENAGMMLAENACVGRSLQIIWMTTIQASEDPVASWEHLGDVDSVWVNTKQNIIEIQLFAQNCCTHLRKIVTTLTKQLPRRIPATVLFSFADLGSRESPSCTVGLTFNLQGGPLEGAPKRALGAAMAQVRSQTSKAT